MGKSKKIIIVIIIVAAVILAAIIAELFLLRNGEGKEVSNNQEENVQANEQNSIAVEPPDLNTFMPGGNDIVGGSSTTPTPNILEPTSTTYYYSQLNNIGKTIYDGLKQNKDKFKTGTYIFNFGTQFNTLLHTDSGNDELNKAFQAAWDALMYDQVDLFYVDSSKVNLITQYTNIGGINTYTVTIEPREEGNYLSAEFPTQEDVERAQYYVKYMVDQVIDQTQDNSIFQKVRKVHEWLIRHIEYDETSKNASNLYGALLEQKANCEGYSKIFKYVLEKIGVSCVLVPGTATNSQGVQAKHMWNYLQLNSKWYAVDITFDDPVLQEGAVLTDELMERYFLKGSVTLTQTHRPNGTFSEKGTQFKFPEISSQDY